MRDFRHMWVLEHEGLDMKQTSECKGKNMPLYSLPSLVQFKGFSLATRMTVKISGCVGGAALCEPSSSPPVGVWGQQ